MGMYTLNLSCPLALPPFLCFPSAVRAVDTMNNWMPTFPFQPLLLFLPLLLLPAAVLWLVRGRSRRSGPPLPPGTQGFPLLGETLRMISAYKTENPDSFIDDRMRMHGRVFTSHVFGETTVFSAEPDVNRHVLQNEGRLFESSYPSSICTLLGKHSLLLARGSYHKRMHSLTLASFSNQTVLRDRLLPDIDRLVRLNTVHAWKDGQTVVLLDQAKKITFELAVKQLMSCEPCEWTEGLRREYVQVIDGFFSIPFPFGRLLPFTTYGKAIRARTKVADQIRLVLRERIRSFSTSGVRSTDVVDTLLMEGVREEDEVLDFVLALLVAAHETTSTAMTLAVKFLTETPAALAALRDEHDKIKKLDGTFDWNDYKNAMPFTHSVINETLRMSNIVSGVFRRCTSDVDIKGFGIPKGCRVFASFRAVHMSEDYFEESRTFNPWRWQKMKKEEEHLKTGGGGGVSNRALCVFGGGPRLCPGYELARVELCVFLHHLVTSFSWDAAGEDRLVFFPTTRTLKGYPIRVRRR